MRAVIITALPVEYMAVRRHLKDPRECMHDQGTVYEEGRFETPQGSTWDVLIAEIGAGNAGAAAETERALSFYRPEVALFVGIAGGVKDVSLGDVVVATKVYGYESGKARAAFNARPDVYNSAYDLQQRARAEAKRVDWLDRLPRRRAARVFVAPIASGEKIVASRRSDLYRFLSSNYGDTLAVEMEGRGFLQSVHSNSHIRSLIIRGISDLLSKKQQSDGQGWQSTAAENASAFAFEILAKCVSPAGAVAAPPAPMGPQPGRPHSPRIREPEVFEFCESKKISLLLGPVKLGDWNAAANAALAVIADTLPDGRNPTFDAILGYYNCPDEDLKWAALQTVESVACLMPDLIDRSIFSYLAAHSDFSVRASAASLCMELANFAPARVPTDVAIQLSSYKEDWYVQAPANAALKTLARSMPSILRVYTNRLRSDDPLEREHAASALTEVGEHEPDLIDRDTLKDELNLLKEVGDKKCARQIEAVLALTKGASKLRRFKYGL